VWIKAFPGNAARTVPLRGVPLFIAPAGSSRSKRLGRFTDFERGHFRQRRQHAAQ
jgi:hypothetical protein